MLKLHLGIQFKQCKDNLLKQILNGVIFRDVSQIRNVVELKFNKIANY